MNPERWRQIDTIFKSALERATEERSAFLDEACADDVELRREVESLIASDQGESFMPTQQMGALAAVAAERLLAERGRPGAPDPGPPSSPDSIDDGRFVPGDVLAGRYRVVGLLGRGGMGEVYRADDLRLKQPVALKFLPERLSKDGASLARFYQEVSVGRQVSHSHVCRVYDVGEADGLHFLSMEYVRGEELASVIKRFGRLPPDKAVEVARQLCGGLAAIHDKGVIHRDLKPANVMIDERGDVRITDFGIAALAGDVRGREAFAGTPAYMSPEQLAGGELTARSDIYSLGLVLYELFTGRRAFEADTLEALLSLRRSDTSPTSPSSIVKDLDPLIERVIGRCLEREADKRPASALEVAAALPGGDPLAAALAAGETPSPEMVAAAPKEGALRPSVAASLLASALAVLALTCWMSKYVSLHRLAPLENPPEVLRARAQDIARRLGYADAPADSEYGMYESVGYLRHMAEHERSPDWWEKLRAGDPSAYYFWYRQSPRPLATGDDQFVEFQKPPQNVPGMLGVALDMEGRLRYFAAVPERSGAAREGARAFDWAALFAEAGLDPQDFRPVESARPPPHGADARAAWEGTAAGPGGHAVRVEAAALGGRAVQFEVVYPWETPFRQGPTGQLWQNPLTTTVIIAGFLLALFGSALLAFRNLRLGRGDRRGAFRLALFYFTLLIAAWAFDAHHVASPLGEFNALIEALQSAGFVAAFIWLVYVGLEPYIRRRWPWRIISWSRLLAGDFRDPLVGRDILIGGLAGFVTTLIVQLGMLTPGWLGQPADAPDFPDTPMLGLRFFATKLTTQFMAASTLALVYLFILLLLFVLLRRERLAAVALGAVYAFAIASLIGGIYTLPFAAVLALVAVGVLYRYGLLALVSVFLVNHLWTFFPVTTELGAWYAADFVLATAVTLAVVLYGFYTSLAGQPLLRGDLLED
jgi:hypothetical protein